MATQEELEAAARLEAENRQKELATIVNSAVSTQLKQLRGKMLDDVKTSLGEMIGPALAEALKANGGGASGGAGGGGGNGGGGGGGSSDGGAGGGAGGTRTPQDNATLARIEKLEKDLNDARQSAVQANERAWTDKTYASVQSRLQGYVLPDLLDVATDHVFKRVAKHEDGSPVFKIMRSPFSGAPEEEVSLPLDAGLEDWTRTKDAARFMPAPDPRTGKRPAIRSPQSGGSQAPRDVPTYSQPAKTSDEKTRRAMARESALAERFPNLARQ